MRSLGGRKTRKARRVASISRDGMSRISPLLLLRDLPVLLPASSSHAAESAWPADECCLMHHKAKDSAPTHKIMVRLVFWKQKAQIIILLPKQSTRSSYE